MFTPLYIRLLSMTLICMTTLTMLVLCGDGRRATLITSALAHYSLPMTDYVGHSFI